MYSDPGSRSMSPSPLLAVYGRERLLDRDGVWKAGEWGGNIRLYLEYQKGVVGLCILYARGRVPSECVVFQRGL